MTEVRWRAPRPPQPPKAPATATSRWLVIVFVIAIAAVPVHQLAADAAARRLPHLVRFFGQFPNLAHIEAWEEQLDRESLAPAAARRPILTAQAQLLRRGNEKVAIGRDGWLFYRPGLRHVVGPPIDSTNGDGRPLTAITAFGDALATRGIALIMVPIPDKASLYPERLAPGWRAQRAPRNAGEAALLRALTERGIAVVDPLEALWSARAGREPLYLRGDTHWSPTGMALVARQVAARIRELQPGWWPSAYGLRPQTVAQRGDLHDMLDLAGDGLFAPTNVTIEAVVDAAGEPYRPATWAEVVLLGDSFTNIFSDPALHWGESAGFGERLAFELGRPVDVVALNDGGVNGSRARLAQQLERLAAARVVVWQFAVRDLTDRAGQWATIPLGPAGE